MLRFSFKTLHPTEKLIIAYLEIIIFSKPSVQRFILFQDLLLFMPLQVLTLLIWD